MNIEQDIDFELERMRKVALRMDALFLIPGTNVSLGLDNIVGLVPVVGDVAAMMPGVWMIHRARRLGARPGTLAYMITNTVIDFAIGTIPIVGDIFDAVYNANIRNYRALMRDLNKRSAMAKPVHRPSMGCIKAV
ncbi:DUF4112 domain-containing protein [Yoonia sp. 2307UL14-13]|uniref:DUF4112 domain-containing protein n=1 Tax=Yoonia sp. 2307UL14-13 TaxID=3126506 RepID=UPI0030B5DC03